MMLILNPNILKILTLIIALIFSTFSTNWSAKVCISKALFKNKIKYN